MRRIRLNETELNKLVSKIIYEDSTSSIDAINNQAMLLWNSETDENKEKYWDALIHCLQLRDKTIDEKGKITYIKKERGSPIVRLLKGVAVTVGSAVATIYFAIKAGESATPGNSFGNIGDNIFATLGIAGIAKGVRMTSKEIQEIADCVREKMGKTQSSIKTPQNTPMEPMNKPTSDSTNLKESKMKNKIRLTESELVGLIKKVISEQDEDRQTTRGIQKFLNEKLKLNLKVDGLTGPNSETSEAIKKYQDMIRVIPTDGVWGHDTWEKMPEKDRLRLRKLVADEGGVLDKIWNYFGWDD